MPSVQVSRQKFPSIASNHHDIAAYLEFHRILALVLFPPNCVCELSCRCETKREKVVLSLNVNLYNQTYQENVEPDVLRALV